MSDTNISFPNYNKLYFEKMLKLDRYHIARRLKEITKYDLKTEDKNFDATLANILRTETISEKPIIQTEYSYNITYIPEFQIVAKYELFDKYSIDYNTGQEEKIIN